MNISTSVYRSIFLFAVAFVCITLFSSSSFLYPLNSWDEAKGFTTIIVAVLLMGGIQLLAIGIMGEYIGRIFNETKKRPTYLASHYNEDKLY